MGLSYGLLGTGVFRDSEGNVILQFNKAMMVDSAVWAGVHVLREAMLQAATLRCASSHSFMFKSNLKSIVAWVMDPASISWWYHNVLRKCFCHVFRFGISWSIKYISRMGNDTTAALARMGVREDEFYHVSLNVSGYIPTRLV